MMPAERNADVELLREAARLSGDHGAKLAALLAQAKTLFAETTLTTELEAVRASTRSFRADAETLRRQPTNKEQREYHRTHRDLADAQWSR